MADVDNKIKMIVEGLLLAAGKPLNLAVIAGVFSEDERPDHAELKEVLTAIAKDCNDRGFELSQVASGYRFQVKQDVSQWIARLWEEKPPRYSRALLETLALIAYRQPITRGDVEEIRGVAVSSNIIRTLVDREWVRIVGHKDVPGKPALYATTRQFLDYFNLKSIQELPPLSEIRELAQEKDEFDVEDDLADRKVLELPEEGEEQQPEVLNEDGEPLEYEPEELPDEDEAVALSKKPLDEILGLTEDAEEQPADSDGEDAQEGNHGQQAKVDRSEQSDPFDSASDTGNNTQSAAEPDESEPLKQPDQEEHPEREKRQDESDSDSAEDERLAVSSASEPSAG